MRTRDEVLREFGMPCVRSFQCVRAECFAPQCLMADRIRELESQQAASEPVAWWISPHGSMVAGATVNRSLAEARVAHGAVIRPLVFGDTPHPSVSPPSGDGCTKCSAAAVTALDEWRIYDRHNECPAVNGVAFDAETAAAFAAWHDKGFPEDAPHRVMRVCLREEERTHPTTPTRGSDG